MTSGEPGEVLAWDSEFFGFRVGRVNSRRLTPERSRQVVEWARDNAVRCVYFLVDAEDSNSVHTAEESGFRHVDIRVTRERALGSEPKPAAELGPAQQEDLPALLEIARRSHRTTRFYHDPHFPDERCDALYMRWVERGFEEQDQEVLVIREAEQAWGYILCSAPEHGCGQIGLIAVVSEAHGTGLGGSLVRGGLAWMAARGCERVEVVSQGRNLAASRLYERQGFVTLRMEHWFHLWLGE